MSKQQTPCDYGECPFNARYSEDCRYYCGLGVDEDSQEDEKDEVPSLSEYFPSTEMKMLWVEEL